MTADIEEAAQLRRTSPFVGVLALQEKLEILRRADPEMAATVEMFERVRYQSADSSRVGPKH